MPSLFLSAGDPAWVPDSADGLLRVLGELGLIGAGLSDREGCYRAGPQFLALVTFLGCSPQVTLDPAQPGDGQPACFVRLVLYPDVRFVAGAHQSRVRCPHCRSQLGDITATNHDTPVSCPGCGATVPASGLDWRQSAGFGRCFLEIGGVYPHEAVPSDRLLDSLHAFSRAGWQYFYTG